MLKVFPASDLITEIFGQSIHKLKVPKFNNPGSAKPLVDYCCESKQTCFLVTHWIPPRCARDFPVTRAKSNRFPDFRSLLFFALACNFGTHINLDEVRIQTKGRDIPFCLWTINNYWKFFQLRPNNVFIRSLAIDYEHSITFANCNTSYKEP